MKPVGVKLRFTKTLETEPLAPAHIDLSTETNGRDYPQFLGPNRNGIVTGYRLARDWDKHPPREVWRRPVGAGWSAFAVAGKYAFTQEQRGKYEVVTCYELLTGKPVWRHADEGGYFDLTNVTGDGPRATPTVADGRVFTVGGKGLLNCLDVHTGSELWSVNILEPFHAENSHRGKSCSPLVLDDVVVVTGGAERGPSIIAYDKDTGDVVWTGAWGEGRANEGTVFNSYASPTLAELHGVPQILNVEDKGLASYDPKSGEQLWKAEWPWAPGDPKTCQPVVLDGNRVFYSAEYSCGCVVYQIHHDLQEGFSAELLWKRDDNMRTKFSNVVLRDGVIYGINDVILTCIDVEKGEKQWRRGGRYGHAQIMLADDLIVVMAEDGDVALVEATPDKFRELGLFTPLSSITWNTPALAIPDDSADVAYLLVRNDQEAACYELQREPAAPEAAR